MFANLNGWHAVIIIAVILLLFGAPKIPQLARSLGQSIKILKTEIREDPKSGASETPDRSAPAAPATIQPVDETIAR
jgi:sec-independent protein translocase protein TatA